MGWFGCWWFAGFVKGGAVGGGNGVFCFRRIENGFWILFYDDNRGKYVENMWKICENNLFGDDFFYTLHTEKYRSCTDLNKFVKELKIILIKT